MKWFLLSALRLWLLFMIGFVIGGMIWVLAGCSTVTLCCPNHQGMVQSTTFDLLGTTSVTCGTNTASVGGPPAIGAALTSIISQYGGKVPIPAAEARATAPAYTCQ